jgi:hypothetical protein
LGATHVAVRAMDRGVERLSEPQAGFRCAKRHIDSLEPFIRAMR